MSAEPASGRAGEPLLAVHGLRVRYAATAVDGIDFMVARGECVGLVGESGAGKSQALLACAGLLPPTARVAGSVRLAGRELLGGDERAWRAVRGRRIGFVFQDAAGALAPHLTIGAQLADAVRAHADLSRAEAMRRARALLARVHVPDPDARLHQYPHELSGGLRQRALIASALAGEPELLLADEPTSALDVTVQRQIVDLFRELRRTSGLALLLVTHDFGVAAGLCDRVAVLQAGRIVETGAIDALHAAPRHAYTAALLAARPRLDGPGGAGAR